MENKVIFHDMKNQTRAKLVKCNQRCTFIIDGVANNPSIISMSQYGYFLTGSPLPSIIKIWKENNKNNYVITRDKPSDVNIARYITIKTIESNVGGSPLISDYEENFDTTNFTELTRINKPMPIYNEEISLIANELYNYRINNGNSNYQTYASILLISARNSQGVGGAGVYLAYKKNEGSSIDYVITPISETGTISQFNVTGTNNGISLQNTVNSRVKITEISVTQPSII